jgi:rhamnulokinase
MYISVGLQRGAPEGEMDLPSNGRAVVAIDLGAQSCRVSLLRWEDRQLSWSLVYRVSNAPIESAQGLIWNMQSILLSVEEGLRLCAEAAPEGIAAIGIDGWAVDYVRFLKDGSWLGNPFCYRDARTVSAEVELQKIISAQRFLNLRGFSRCASIPYFSCTPITYRVFPLRHHG